MKNLDLILEEVVLKSKKGKPVKFKGCVLTYNSRTKRYMLLSKGGKMDFYTSALEVAKKLNTL